MTKDEALKMAIEVMDNIEIPFRQYADEAINACKEALKPHPDCDEACMFQCEMETKPHHWQGLTDDEIWDIANFLGKNKEWDYPVMFAKTIEQALKDKNT